MWAMIGKLIFKLLPMLGTAWKNRQERQATKNEIVTTTEAQLTLSRAKLDHVRTLLQKGSWKDEYLTIWLTLIYSIPFAPAVYTLCNGDVEMAKAAAELGRQATVQVFGESAGWIMGSVVCAVFGISRALPK